MNSPEDYSCDVCSQIDTSTQNKCFDSCPDNVLIQLKVFDNNLQKLTDIAICLDREIDILGNKLYLCGVIYHEGRTLESGHYYTEIYANGHWYIANDEDVNIIDDITIISFF